MLNRCKTRLIPPCTIARTTPMSQSPPPSQRNLPSLLLLLILYLKKSLHHRPPIVRFLLLRNLLIPQRNLNPKPTQRFLPLHLPPPSPLHLFRENHSSSSPSPSPQSSRSAPSPAKTYPVYSTFSCATIESPSHTCALYFSASPSDLCGKKPHSSETSHFKPFESTSTLPVPARYSSRNGSGSGGEFTSEEVRNGKMKGLFTSVS